MKSNKLPKSAVSAATMLGICLLASSGAWAKEQAIPKTIETHFSEVTLDAIG